MLTVDGSIGQDHPGGGIKFASETYSLQHAWPTTKCRSMIFRGRRIRRLVKLLRDCWQRDMTEESALDTRQKQAFSPPSFPADRIWRQNNLLHNRHRGTFSSEVKQAGREAD